MTRLVLAHGCFDLLHLGHIRHLKEARSLGDKLVVSVTADKFVAKGLGRPQFSAEQRAEALRALDCVDEVVINDAPDAIELIADLRPDVYVKGIDYKGSTDRSLLREKRAVEALGGKVHYTSALKWSSSSIINRDRFSPAVLNYLAQAKRANLFDKVLGAFERANKLRTVFIGETIIDVYRYVQGLGRASKELMLATVETDVETFNGGVLAAALHGEWENASIITHDEAITKTRYVDKDFNRKLFDVYSARRIEPSDEWRKHFREELRLAVDNADVLIAFDFGHGMIGSVERSLISTARFSAINAQTNAGNYGFNPVTKYKSADLICIDDPEARLAAGMDRAPIGAVVTALAERIKCSRFIITHGKNGSIFGDGKIIARAPAFVSGGVDTMGAGDATLAVVAPLVAAGLDLDAAAFVGNVAGAIKLSILGHRRHVGRQEIIQTMEALLS
jgi:rfaE bifunctional protein nucleotidyltransferase chain/domain